MTGIKLSHGGTYTNTGTVEGYSLYGIEIYGGAGSVINSGMIYCPEWGTAVVLKDGGSVTNSGSIFSDMPTKRGEGVSIGGVGGTVTNSGKINGDPVYGSGIYLTGGTVTNLAGALISGGRRGVSFGIATGAVWNSGKIGSGYGSIVDVAIYMKAGGSVCNYGTGQIGGCRAIVIGGGAGRVTNAGVISGGERGIQLGAGGAVVNEAGATITTMGTSEFGPDYGVYIAGAAGSVTNAGTIAGASAAIKFAGGGVNSLILQSGSVLNGSAIGSMAKGATNVLEVKGFGVANNAFLNFQKLNVWASGTWALGGAETIGLTKVLTGGLAISGVMTTTIKAAAATAVSTSKKGVLNLDGASLLGGTLTDKGMLTETGGSVTLGDALGDAALITIAATGTWEILDNSGLALGPSKLSSISNLGLFKKTGGGVSVIAPAIANGGNVLVSAGALDFQGAVTGTGVDTISGASTLEFDASVANKQTIDFTGASGVLVLGAPHGFAAALSGFDTVGSSDAVELLGAWSISGFSTTSTQSTLMLSKGTRTASLVFDGSYSESLFHQAVSSEHTTITYG